MLIKEPNREYDLDITDESSGVIAVLSDFSRQLPFYVYCSGQLYGKKDYFTRTYYLEGTLFLLTLSGQGWLSYQGGEYDLLPGSVVFLDCTQFHEYHTVGDSWENCYIRFHGDSCPALLQHVHQNGFSAVQLENLDDIKSKVDEVIGLCLVDKDSAALTRSLLITEILTSLCRSANKKSTRPQLAAPVLLAKKYIEKNYSQFISLTDIAEAAGVSSFHLSRLFKAQMDLSPHQYLTHVRMKRAKQLLLTTQLYVKDICEQVGFPNVNVFIRSFKTHVGTTPASFRSKAF